MRPLNGSCISIQKYKTQLKCSGTKQQIQNRDISKLKLRKCSLWFYIVHIRYIKFELSSEVRTRTTISRFRHAGNKM
jgi:hypothetical protein